MQIKQKNQSNGVGQLAAMTYISYGSRIAWQLSPDNDRRSSTIGKSVP